MKIEKDKNKSKLKTTPVVEQSSLRGKKSKILALGLALIIVLVGFFNPVEKTLAGTVTCGPKKVNPEDFGKELKKSISEPPGDADYAKKFCENDGRTFVSWLPEPKPKPESEPEPEPEDPRYTLLAPLPCKIGDDGCEMIDGKPVLKTFDPTGKGGGALGGYLNLMITLFIGICAVLAVIMIVMGGIEYMTTELISGKEAGKQKITNAIFGLILALGAWTILNQINPDLLKTSLESLEEVIVKVELVTLSDGTYSSSGGAGAGGSKADCVVPENPSNACSPQTLANSCFSGRANEASIICSVESRSGTPDVESGSDRLNMGAGPAYSIGLWQINLTANEVGGLNCPSAFTARCDSKTATRDREHPTHGPVPGNCSAKIKPEKMQLYKDCVAAAKNIQKNTQAACKVYGNNGNTFKPWQYTANKCGIK